MRGAKLSASKSHAEAADAAKLREKLTRSREVAVAVAGELGDAPGSVQMTVLTELLQTSIFDLMMPEDDVAPALDTKQISEIAKGLKDITTAARGNIAFMGDAEKRAVERTKTAAAKVVDTVGAERGISAETMNAIKAGIFGIET